MRLSDFPDRHFPDYQKVRQRHFPTPSHFVGEGVCGKVSLCVGGKVQRRGEPESLKGLRNEPLHQSTGLSLTPRLATVSPLLSHHLDAPACQQRTARAIVARGAGETTRQKTKGSWKAPGGRRGFQAFSGRPTEHFTPFAPQLIELPTQATHEKAPPIHH